MKRMFKHPRVLFLTIQAAFVIALAIGCGSPGEPAAKETDPIVVDTPTTTPTDTLPVIDTTAGGKPPVPIKPPPVGIKPPPATE